MRSYSCSTTCAGGGYGECSSTSPRQTPAVLSSRPRNLNEDDAVANISDRRGHWCNRWAGTRDPDDDDRLHDRVCSTVVTSGRLLQAKSRPGITVQLPPRMRKRGARVGPVPLSAHARSRCNCAWVCGSYEYRQQCVAHVYYVHHVSLRSHTPFHFLLSWFCFTRTYANVRT